MTNPTPDNAWNALDLPVLTDVVEVDVTASEVPVYDFTAELDALAQAVPAEVPELSLPPELTLDDVLGEDAAHEAEAGLNTSQLIERLPSLDLEVDLPAELSLDDVLPGLDAARPNVVPAAAPAEEFSFSLQEEAVPADGGLSALFARASFEPVAPVAPVPVLDVPLAAQASVDHFAAQLDGFDMAADLPELPGDAFLSKADSAAPQVDVFSADSRDDEWAGTWEPPQTVEPPLLSADDLDHVPPPAWQAEAQDVLPPLAADAATGSAFEPLPWDVPEQPAAANFAMSVDDILASLQPGAAPQAAADAEPVFEPVAELLTLPDVPPVAPPSLHAVTEAAPVEADVLPTAPAGWSETTSDAIDDIAAPAVPAPLPLAADTISLPPLADTMEEAAAVFSAAGSELTLHAAAVDEVPPAPEANEAAIAAAPPLAISLDSLPTGVLGGGLGLAAAATTTVMLGSPAAQLPGGGDWQPMRPAFDAGDKEVELAWARDLGAEPPLDLDDLPPAQAEAVAAPVIAEVIRVRRSHAPAEAPVVPVAATVPAQPVAPAVTPLPHATTEAIHIEAIGEALPQPPAAAVPVAPAPGLAGLDEAALIEALYERVLPRMKVELTLWMQDALEQQAKQLMAGVMKQLKEDFDMMLAESLRASLREALEEAASKQGVSHD